VTTQTFGLGRFDMYAVPPPGGEWSYVLDEPGIAYRRGLIAQRLRPGHWPFAYADPGLEHKARRSLDRHADGGRLPLECGAASVRLAPDTRLYSWRNEEVSVHPDAGSPHLAWANMHLRVRPQGLGGVHLDLQAGTYQITQLPDGTPDHLRGQADDKARKLVAFFAEHLRLRDTDLPRPVTAADLEKQREDARAERVRAYCAARGLYHARHRTFCNDHFTIGNQRMSVPQVAATLIPDLLAPPPSAEPQAGLEAEL
jgi:hypothetical protein